MGATAAKIVLISSGETSWGTTGNPTRKVHGITDATLKIDSEVEAVPAVGWYGPGPVAEEVSQSGSATIEGTACYEEMPSFLNAFFVAINNSTSTTGDDGAPPYRYPYEAPGSSTQACYTYTIHYGTTGQAYRAPGSVLNNLVIRGEAGGLWTYSMEAFAKQIVPSTSGISTGMTDRTVNPIRMADTNLAVAAFTAQTTDLSATGSIVSATLIDFELTVNPNRHLKTFAGSLFPGDWGDSRYEGTLRMTLEFNSTVKGYVDAALGSTGAVVQRAIRIGATEGSSATLKSMNLDFAGIKSEGETLWTDRDGNMTVETMWQGMYSTGISNWFECDVIHGSSSTT